MRVLVTGTGGRVGSATAREFLAHGYTVRGLDQHTPPEDLRGKIETVYADLADRLALLKAAEGCDAIAHLAAIPNPARDAHLIFETNVTGTQYVLSAAEAHGIKRVALASTCCAFGIYFALHQIDPQYLPMDEKHPALPQDLYGLSKVLNEETAAGYTRRSGMTTVSLRLTSVMNLENMEHHRWVRHSLTSDEERKNDLWSYVDIRDTARAFRLAIENAPEGTNNTVIIAARDSFTSVDIRHLVRRHFPQFTEQVAHLAPHASLYDTRKAEEVMGWVAEHNWRDNPALADLLESK
jgi:nucleoside-diphosphate-sugar epimerase